MSRRPCRHPVNLDSAMQESEDELLTCRCQYQLLDKGQGSLLHRSYTCGHTSVRKSAAAERQHLLQVASKHYTERTSSNAKLL